MRSDPMLYTAVIPGTQCVNHLLMLSFTHDQPITLETEFATEASKQAFIAFINIYGFRISAANIIGIFPEIISSLKISRICSYAGDPTNMQ